MRQGIVDVAAAVGELPGKAGMNRFVAVEGAGAQIPEAEYRRDGQYRRQGDKLPAGDEQSPSKR